jgi:hypothetical protein
MPYNNSKGKERKEKKERILYRNKEGEDRREKA